MVLTSRCSRLQEKAEGVDKYRNKRYTSPMDRKATSYRLTTTVLELICSLSEALGLNQTAVIELAVRELAKRNKIKP